MLNIFQICVRFYIFYNWNIWKIAPRNPVIPVYIAIQEYSGHFGQPATILFSA